MQLPLGSAMNQRHGGTDDLEHEFATTRHKNPNPTLAETRGMLGKQTGHRAANFTKNMKSNSRGDKNTSIKDLYQDLRRKRYNDNK